MALTGLGPPDDLVPVFFPRGLCQTGALEVEVWDRGAEDWQPHPEHPRIAADRCYEEEASLLLNEIRIRCVDPEGGRRASDWVVGARIDQPLPPELCERPPVEVSDPA